MNTEIFNDDFIYKFTAKSCCETILKISTPLVKLQAREQWQIPWLSG